MMRVFRALLIVAAVSLELYVAYAALHPRVSPEYRAFFIDHTTKDWKTPHYPATPEQGITFSKVGWPEFVRYGSGFSSREDWGRWSDAEMSPAAALTFNRPFSGPLCIEFSAHPSAAELGKQMTVALGQSASVVTLSNPDFTTYRISFDDAQPASTLEFRFSGAVPPNEKFYPASRDSRRLGIGVAWLRMLPGVCKEGQKAGS